MSAVYELALEAPLEPRLLLSAPREETMVCTPVQRSAVSQTNLQLDLLLQSIGSRSIRESVQPVFVDLLRLLDCLHLFGDLFSEFEQARETLTMFELVHVEARAVVNNIHSLTTSSELDESLIETLDGIAFAIGHDLHQVFKLRLSGLPYQAPAELVIGELSNSHGLLTNCARESIVTLARQFDPTMTADRLFEDSNTRLTESLVLHRDLTELIRFVRSWEETPGELAAAAIIERVVRFGHGSKRFLMYRDWKEFDMFSARITLASSNRKTLGPVLDSFACYLETLLRLVSSRSVLANLSGRFVPSVIQCTPMDQ